MMDSILDPSVEDLRQQSERGRAQLANTVDNLRDKVGDTAAEIKTLVSPAHIKAEIRTYVREERERLTDTIQRTARENPLQAAAIGAAIAYPAWGLLRAIPMPLMLIGAGLFLTSSRGKRTMNDAKDKAAEAYRQGADMATDAVASVQDAISERSETVNRAVSSAGATVSDMARDAVDTVTSRAKAATEQAGAAVDRAAATAESAAHSAKNQAGELQRNASNAVMAFIEQNPILVAGVGAAVGAVLAASIPSSDAENRLFGPPRQALKERASALVADGVEKAKDAAAGMAGEIAEDAAREGLDAGGLKRTVDEVMAGVQTVASRGLDTVLDGVAPIVPSDNQQHSH